MINLIDCDGVLADFAGAILQRANFEFKANHTLQDIDQWDIPTALGLQKEWFYSTVKQEGFCAGLPVLPGALQACEDLRRIGPLYCVTSPWSGRATSAIQTEGSTMIYCGRCGHYGLADRDQHCPQCGNLAAWRDAEPTCIRSIYMVGNKTMQVKLELPAEGWLGCTLAIEPLEGLSVDQTIQHRIDCTRRELDRLTAIQQYRQQIQGAPCAEVEPVSSAE